MVFVDKQKKGKRKRWVRLLFSLGGRNIAGDAFLTNERDRSRGLLLANATPKAEKPLQRHTKGLKTSLNDDRSGKVGLDCEHNKKESDNGP